MRLLKAVTWLCIMATVLVGVWILISPETHSGGPVTSLGVLSVALVSIIVITERRKTRGEEADETSD